MLTWRPKATSAEQKAREIVSAAMWMHSTFKDEIWLWRGQASKNFGVEPGMHTRVLNAKGFDPTENTAPPPGTSIQSMSARRSDSAGSPGTVVRCVSTSSGTSTKPGP